MCKHLVRPVVCLSTVYACTLQVAIATYSALVLYALYSLLPGLDSKLLLLDLHCYKIPNSNKRTREELLDFMRERGVGPNLPYHDLFPPHKAPAEAGSYHA